MNAVWPVIREICCAPPIHDDCCCNNDCHSKCNCGCNCKNECNFEKENNCNCDCQKKCNCGNKPPKPPCDKKEKDKPQCKPPYICLPIKKLHNNVCNPFLYVMIGYMIGNSQNCDELEQDDNIKFF